MYYFGTNFYERVDYSDIIRFSMGRKREEGGRKREEGVDFLKIKHFFYGNQFLKALFSDFIGKIKEFNVPMERNSQFVITNKTRNYHGRVIKLLKKGESESSSFLYGILLK